jgi:hypothetical protein
MNILKDFVRIIFGVDENTPVSKPMLVLVLSFIVFLIFILSL